MSEKQPKDYEELDQDLLEAYKHLSIFNKILYNLQDNIILALVATLGLGFYIGIRFGAFW